MTLTATGISSRLTLGQFSDRLYGVGRIYGPGVLFDAWHRGDIDHDIMAAFIGPVWSGAEYPFTAMTQSCWASLFRAAGFTVDGVPADRPCGTVRIYRGSIPALRRRWSWTSSLEVARRFSLGFGNGGFAGRQPGHVYAMEVDPPRILCVITTRGEGEHVVDTRGAKITKLEPAA